MQTVLAFPNLSFHQPLYLGSPPDGTDRIVVAQQDGLILIFANDPAVATASTFLDLRGSVHTGGEQGLLGVAFHPDYAINGAFYLNYIADGPRRTVVSRWQVSADPDAADPGSEQILLTYDQPFTNHNGGAMAFGPDGMLYISSGDGGSANDPNNNGQDLTTLLGKILRIADDGSIPPDNPFVGGASGERGEIWAYGLRNPWRMSFDRDTGQLWVGDVGQNAEEEIDLIVEGGNYGWRVYEGALSNINPGGWDRMGRRDPWGMPPLGSHVVDQAGVGLVGEWIDG